MWELNLRLLKWKENRNKFPISKIATKCQKLRKLWHSGDNCPKNQWVHCVATSASNPLRISYFVATLGPNKKNKKTKTFIYFNCHFFQTHNFFYNNSLSLSHIHIFFIQWCIGETSMLVLSKWQNGCVMLWVCDVLPLVLVFLCDNTSRWFLIQLMTVVKWYALAPCPLTNLVPGKTVWPTIKLEAWKNCHRGYTCNWVKNRLNGKVSWDFFAPVFSSTSLFWSYKRCPWAVLIFSKFSQSYCTFKTTPRYLGNWGVAQKFLG